MRISRLLFRIALSLLPIAVLSTVWLYLYPIFHSCAFPAVPHSSHVPSVAPFRLLALGDPQLEGDSSLPDPNALIFPSVNDLIQDLRDASSLLEQRDILALAGSGVVKDAVNWLKGKRKAVDLWGNDWYLAHIVRSLRWWTEPTHISVLGDLLGSQWITDGEFEKRASRYWNIVMHGLGNVPGTVFGHEKEDISADANGRLTSSILEGTEQMEEPDISDAEEQSRAPEEGDVFDESVEEPSTSKAERSRLWGGTTEILGSSTSWSTRVINIAGNHDVGYAGDIDEIRIDRFERAFGSVNWDIWFTLPSTDLDETENVASHDGRPALRIVVLNSMNLDTPAWTPELQTETYEFLNHIITTSRPVEDKTHATLLLTHIPLEKEAGICVDSPYFDFFEGGQGVKEQNMLSDHASKIILEGIFGMSSNKDVAGQGQGRRGFVINGHDHAGCDVMHYIRQPAASYKCNTTLVRSHEAYWPPNTKVDGTTATTTLGDLPAETCPALRNDTSHREQCDITPEAEMSEETGDTTEKMDAPPKWKARRFPPLPYDINEKFECTSIHEAPHIREVTLRSMMGEYSGYAGFLAAWFDETLGEKGEWVFEFATCGLGIQHWWWAVHIIWLVLIIAVMAGCVTNILEATVLRKTSTSDNAFVGVTSRTVSSAQRSHGDHKYMGGRSAGQRLSSSPVR